MPVQFKIFMIPARYDTAAQDELNAFLRTVRALTVHHEFVHNGDASYWNFCVEYMTDGSGPEAGTRSAGKSGRNRIDYKETLSPEDFAVFAKLRDWRKDAAAREAVPVYTVFTNDQLAHMAWNRPDSLAALGGIDGIGDGRVKKYGRAVLAIIA